MMQNAMPQRQGSEQSPREQMSAWLDGEFDALDGEFDPAHINRDTWDTYHLIGDVLRSADLAITPSAGFNGRLSRALDAEMPIVAAPVRKPAGGGWRIGLSGAAIAAALATVVWVSQPYFFDASPDGTRILADAGAVNGSGVADDANLMAYLEAHRQVAGPSAIRQVSFDQPAGR